MVAVEVQGDRIRVDGPWSVKDMIKQVPGARWEAFGEDKDKCWTVPLTWAACKQLRGIFGKDLVMGPDLRQWGFDHANGVIAPLMEMRAQQSPMFPEHKLYQPGGAYGSLYPFQQAGLDWLRGAKKALLTDEMGTGKTIQALSTLRAVVGAQEPCLIICPNSMKGTWAKEAAKWYPGCTPYVIAGSAAQRKKLFAQAAEDSTALVIINFESVRLHSSTAGFGSIALARCAECGGAKNTTVTASKCEVHDKELNSIPFAAVVVDEAHRIKDGQAKQTRAIWSVGQNPATHVRLAMTGTPVANDASDLWAIMHFVDPVEYPTKSKFVDRYCATYFNKWGALEVGGLNPATKDELFSFLHPRMRRTEKKDVLTQLPPKVFGTRYVEMSPKQAKSYEQMADGLVTRLDDGTLMVAPNNLAVNTRLLQFSSAYMESQGEDKDGNTIYKMCEPCPKLDVMEEVLEELGERPLVVAAVHKQLIDLAEARLIKAGIPYGKITGDVPQWERDLFVQQFQEGKLRVMLLTMQAGGVGITLTAADTMLRLQCSWSMVDNTQVVDRIHRIGSEKHQQVTIIDVVTAGTIEVDQVKKVQAKHEILKEVVNG